MPNPQTAGRKTATKPRTTGRIRKDIRKMAQDILDGLPPNQDMINVLLGRKMKTGGKVSD